MKTVSYKWYIIYQLWGGCVDQILDRKMIIKGAGFIINKLQGNW